MSPSADPIPFHVNRPLDLREIDAVGFDLDHTLALYDDHAVNVLAAEETMDLLAGRRGNPRGRWPVATDPIPAARGLSLDLRHGNVVKITADRRVRLARRGESWLAPEEIRARYPEHDPAHEHSTWHIHSPFDVPALWFFLALAPEYPCAAGGDASAHLLPLLTDIRATLDASHTRGQLKARIGRDMGRFVSPAGRVREGLERWSRAGKRLFVVTNSDRAFATAVLDTIVGPAWRELFALVATEAGKPAFFSSSARERGETPARAVNGGAWVVERATARVVEDALGVARSRLLYVGDNARADVAPAGGRGWRTAQVVAELEQDGSGSPWGRALDHEGAPTWFAGVVREYADVVMPRVDRLLDLDPEASLPAGEEFFARLARAAGGGPGPGGG